MKAYAPNYTTCLLTNEEQKILSRMRGNGYSYFSDFFSEYNGMISNEDAVLYLSNGDAIRKFNRVLEMVSHQGELVKSVSPIFKNYFRVANDYGNGEYYYVIQGERMGQVLYIDPTGIEGFGSDGFLDEDIEGIFYSFEIFVNDINVVKHVDR